MVHFLWQQDDTYCFSRSCVKGIVIVVKPCKHDTDWTVSARTIKLSTRTNCVKRMTPIHCQDQSHMLHIVVKPCKQATDWTVSATTIKLGTLTAYDKRKTPIAFQGHGSKAKVTCYTLLFNLENIQTGPFQLGPSNLVHILLMTKGRHLFIFKVGGQRSSSHATHCC